MPSVAAASQALSLPEGATFFAFGGQGSQKPGMADHLAGNAQAEEVFSCASDIFGFDVEARMGASSQEELNRTAVAQPTLCALQVAQAHALAARGVCPQAVLGFSLGQIAALEAAGMLSMQDTFRLCARRAELMEEAAREHSGAMLAVLKLTSAEVEEMASRAASDTGCVLVAANYNCEGQTVVSGELAAIERFKELAEAARVRVKPVATSGAFHSPLMAEAADELRAFMCDSLIFAEPVVPLIANDTAEPLCAARAAEALACHLTSPVRFRESVEALAGAGAACSVELGCGGVLTKLIKRIAPGIERKSAADMLAPAD